MASAVGSSCLENLFPKFDSLEPMAEGEKLTPESHPTYVPWHVY